MFVWKVLKGVILCFSVFFNVQMMLQSQIAILNDVKVWNNEVRVCSSNPCGLFLMALNAPFSSVFLKSQTTSKSLCAGLLYWFIWKVCVWTGQSEYSKLLEAEQELKQSVSDKDKNPGKNRAAAVGCMRKQKSFLSIKACKPALVVTKNKI